MSFKVNFNKASSKAEAYELVKARITPEYIQKWKVNADLSYDPSDKIVAKGKGFTLTMSFSDSDCEVSLELGMLLKPLKSMINGEVEKQITNTI